MRRPQLRRIAGTGTAMLAAITIASLTSGLPAAAGPLRTPSQVSAAAAAPAGEAISSLNACLNENKRGDIALLIDTSGSLGTQWEGENATDPKGLRVDASQRLLIDLAESARANQLVLNVAVAGFGSDVDVVTDFTPLTDETLPGLVTTLDTFKTRDLGYETDYWTALSWVQDSMEKRRDSVTSGGTSCQLTFWFSDGGFHLNGRGAADKTQLTPPLTDTKTVPGFEEVVLSTDAIAAEVEQAARLEMCRPGGLIDQIRLDKVVIAAVGLQGPTPDPDAGTSDTFQLMRSIAENTEPGCGEQPGNGIFVDAASDTLLASAVHQIVRGPGITLTDERPVCTDETCESFTFYLDDSLDQVHVIANVVDKNGEPVPSDAIAVEIYEPGVEEPLLIAGMDMAPQRSEQMTNADAAWSWSESGLTLDLDRGEHSWLGEWKITFIEVTGQGADWLSQLNISLTSDLQVVPTLDATQAWRLGDTSPPVNFRIERSDGSPVDLDELGVKGISSAALSLAGGTGRTLDVPIDLTGPVTIPIPSDASAGDSVLRTYLAITTAGGYELDPFIRQLTIPIQAALGSPYLEPGMQTVDFGQIDGTDTVMGTLTVAAPPESDGCVWISGASLLVHQASVTGVNLETAAKSAETCQTVPAGTTAQIEMQFGPTSESNGRLQGDLEVHLAPKADLDKASITPVPYRADALRSPKGPVFLIIGLTLLVIGLGIPALLLWFSRRQSARFADPTTSPPLSAALIDIQFEGNALAAAGGGPVTVSSNDFRAVGSPTEGRRKLVVENLPLKARAGWNFSSPGYAEMEAPGYVGICGSSPYLNSKTCAPQLPLAVNGTWTLLFERNSAAARPSTLTGRLLLICSSGADSSLRNELLNAATRDGFERLQRLQDDLAKAAGPSAQQVPPQDQQSEPPAYDPFQSGPDSHSTGPGTYPDPFAAGDPSSSHFTGGQPGGGQFSGGQFGGGQFSGGRPGAGQPADDPFGQGAGGHTRPYGQPPGPSAPFDPFGPNEPGPPPARGNNPPPDPFGTDYR